LKDKDNRTSLKQWCRKQANIRCENEGFLTRIVKKILMVMLEI